MFNPLKTLRGSKKHWISETDYEHVSHPNPLTTFWVFTIRIDMQTVLHNHSLRCRRW